MQLWLDVKRNPTMFVSWKLCLGWRSRRIRGRLWMMPVVEEGVLYWRLEKLPSLVGLGSTPRLLRKRTWEGVLMVGGFSHGRCSFSKPEIDLFLCEKDKRKHHTETPLCVTSSVCWALFQVWNLALVAKKKYLIVFQYLTGKLFECVVYLPFSAISPSYKNWSGRCMYCRYKSKNTSKVDGKVNALLKFPAIARFFGDILLKWHPSIPDQAFQQWGNRQNQSRNNEARLRSLKTLSLCSTKLNMAGILYAEIFASSPPSKRRGTSIKIFSPSSAWKNKAFYTCNFACRVCIKGVVSGQFA